MADRKDIDFSYTLTDRVIRLALAGASSNLVCFGRELMDHFRLVFENA